MGVVDSMGKEFRMTDDSDNVVRGENTGQILSQVCVRINWHVEKR